MMNLLESAGFSRANPYYVVQQGKVGTASDGGLASAHKRLTCTPALAQLLPIADAPDQAPSRVPSVCVCVSPGAVALTNRSRRWRA